MGLLAEEERDDKRSERGQQLVKSSLVAEDCRGSALRVTWRCFSTTWVNLIPSYRLT